MTDKQIAIGSRIARHATAYLLSQRIDNNARAFGYQLAAANRLNMATDQNTLERALRTAQQAAERLDREVYPPVNNEVLAAAVIAECWYHSPLNFVRG